MSSTTYACRVNSENVEYIISHVNDFGLNVDYLKDSLEYYTEDGYVLFALFSFNDETGGKTFNEMIEPDFFNSWQFRDTENTKSPWLQIVDRKL